MNTFKLTVASPDGNKFCGDIVKLDTVYMINACPVDGSRNKEGLDLGAADIKAGANVLCVFILAGIVFVNVATVKLGNAVALLG